MTTPLNSLNTVKDFLQIRGSNTTYDTLLPRLSQSATKQIEDALGIKLEAATHTEYFNTRRTLSLSHDLYGQSETGLIQRSDRQAFVLRGLRIDAEQPITVHYDPRMVYGADTLLTETEDYHIDVPEGYLTLFVGTGDYTKALKVTYTAGFEVADGSLEASADVNLTLAHLYQTSFLFKRHRNDNIGMKTDVAVGTEKTSRASGYWNVQQGICKEAAGLLVHYKRPLMGRG